MTEETAAPHPAESVADIVARSSPGASTGHPERHRLSEIGATDLLVITGMSGAGRTTVANVMEDQGWYVVDNLPPQLLVELSRLGRRARRAGRDVWVAAVVDVRAQLFSHQWQAALDQLRDEEWRPRLVFLDATDESLVRRFESVRRPHPLQEGGGLLDGIRRERAELADLRSVADLVIDTSGLNVHQLGRKVRPIFAGGHTESLRLAVMSFGFKYGLPLDADFVLDLRFLPNPFWVPELKALTGQDPRVAEYVLESPLAKDFLERTAELVATVCQGYESEGRRYANIAVGCTGGKHRSVAMAEALAKRVRSPAVATFVVHRDLGQE